MYQFQWQLISFYFFWVFLKFSVFWILLLIFLLIVRIFSVIRKSVHDFKLGLRLNFQNWHSLSVSFQFDLLGHGSLKIRSQWIFSFQLLLLLFWSFLVPLFIFVSILYVWLILFSLKLFSFKLSFQEFQKS